MRKIFSLTITLMAAFLLFNSSFISVNAQNIQLHYDFGRAIDGELSNRPSLTTTIEMFRPDKLGSTFFFTDIDYYSDGVSGVYWEVAREFNIMKSPFAAHIEYNGGTSSDKNSNISTRFQHALLVGGAWNWHSADFSRTFSLQAMYKQYFKGQHAWNDAYASFQTTAVWGIDIKKGLFTFSGYADLWYNPNVNGRLVFQSEPQFWFNLGRIPSLKGFNLSVGTEVELSNNFVWTQRGSNNKFFAIPTIGAKWSF